MGLLVVANRAHMRTKEEEEPIQNGSNSDDGCLSLSPLFSYGLCLQQPRAHCEAYVGDKGL